jgi:predicted short-subunit dehydrogenase-like oxidoreductase (DUF2520 family)
MNRQVPNMTNTQYTIIGDGKIAKHFMHYFDLVEINYTSWNRKQPLRALQHAVNNTDHVLVLISDDAIDKFINSHLFLKDKSLIHFSGSLTINGLAGCHPLMTFSDELYDLETYCSIPFVIDEDIDFTELFPQLENQAYNLAQKDKSKYHALCVIAGNFTQTLMRETNNQLSSELKLPNNIMFPYLLQNTKNFIKNPNSSATGPLQRNDFTTVNKHLLALQNNSLEIIYQAFIQQDKKLKRVKNEY